MLRRVCRSPGPLRPRCERTYFAATAMLYKVSCRSPPCDSQSASRQRGHSVGCRSSRHASLPAVTDVHMMWKKQFGLRNCCIDALPSAIVLFPRTVSLTGCCRGIFRGTASSLWLGAAQQAASERVGGATGMRGTALFLVGIDLWGGFRTERGWRDHLALVARWV